MLARLGGVCMHMCNGINFCTLRVYLDGTVVAVQGPCIDLAPVAHHKLRTDHGHTSNEGN